MQGLCCRENFLLPQMPAQAVDVPYSVHTVDHLSVPDYPLRYLENSTQLTMPATKCRGHSTSWCNSLLERCGQIAAAHHSQQRLRPHSSCRTPAPVSAA